MNLEKIYCPLVVILNLTACSGNSPSAPASKSPDCGENASQVLTGDESKYFVDEDGNAITVDDKFSSLGGSYASELKWLGDEAGPPTTGIAVTLTPVGSATLIETGEKDGPCYDRAISSKIQITVVTDDGVLNTSTESEGWFNDEGFFSVKFTIGTESLEGLSSRFPTVDKNAEVAYGVTIDPDGTLIGDVFISEPISETAGEGGTASSSRSKTRVAQFPVEEQ